MKRTAIMILAAIPALAACESAAPAATPADELKARLAKVSEAGKLAFGHHDDTAYGHAWRYEEGRSDVKDVCGDYPAILSWDLGMIEWSCAENLDSVPFDFIRSEVAKHAGRGGVSVISWHPRNPVSGGDSWSLEGGNVVGRCVTDGDAMNDTMRLWIARAADFIGSLRDSGGKRVGVVFRPWHEHTGSWFWWGYDNCGKDDYVALWKLTRAIFDEKGVDNVVWAYSPDKDNVTDAASYLERYPGDEYVDIMGADVYHFDGEEGVDTYARRIRNVLGAASEAARERGKLVALTETGSESLPMADWWTRVLLPNVKDYPICYVVVWRNGYGNPRHFYAPFKGHGSERSFVEFYNDGRTLFAKEMNEIR